MIKIAQTVGVLALLLSGGARAENRFAFQGNRKLMNAGYMPEPEPYDYVSVCDNGISGPYVAGTNREDCTAQENIELDKLKARKSGELNKVTKCYTVSGYLAAALFGTSFVSCAVADKFGQSNVALFAAWSAGAGGVALIPTAACGFVADSVTRRIDASEDKSKECCEVFPTKAQLAESEASGGNSTVVATPPPANNSMPTNVTTDFARR